MTWLHTMLFVQEMLAIASVDFTASINWDYSLFKGVNQFQLIMIGAQSACFLEQLKV